MSSESAAVVSEAVSAAIPGVTLVRIEPGTDVHARPFGPAGVVLSATADDGRPGLRIEVDLGAAVAYWHPGVRGARALPPDWSDATASSVVQSAPLGALYTASGTVLFGWAASEGVSELTIRCGVSEERKSFVVEIWPAHSLDAGLQVVLDGASDNLVYTIGRLTSWLSARYPAPVLVPGAIARQPVYSTWYTFTQDVNADVVIAEATLAADLGCRSIFIDDGWQRYGNGRGYRGCGDWVPDRSKFADFAATVATIEGFGIGAALWIAPLLLGADSDTFERLAPFAPYQQTQLECHILDPRFAAVRTHIAQTCVRLVVDLGVQLLKIDFLEQAMVYEGSCGSGDIDDVGAAMEALLGEIRARLAKAGHSEVGFEFRQPYVSPAIARYGEILRANDCPGDSIANRQAIMDSRLISVGQIVHSDPMMWGPRGGAVAVAQQLYSSWFAVPQLSMRLATLPAEQEVALRGLLRLWSEHAAVTLDGDLRIHGAERGYDLVGAVRCDLGRSVVVRYAPVTVELDEYPTDEIVIVNATPMERVIIRTDRAFTGGILRSPTGAVAGEVSPRDIGLIDLTVPAYGSVTINRSPLLVAGG